MPADREVVCTASKAFGPYTYFTTNNYGLCTCPNNEYIFVAEPKLLCVQHAQKEYKMRKKSSRWPGKNKEWEWVPALVEGQTLANCESHDLLRKSKHPQHKLVDQMWSKLLPECIMTNLDSKWKPTREFTTLKAEWEAAPNEKLLAFIIALRLYTGPMFQAYNDILRSFATGCTIAITSCNQWKGTVTRDDHLGSTSVNFFGVTLHCINNGIVGLARLTSLSGEQGRYVYRGVAKAKLTKLFTPNEDARTGVEYGFISTTLSKHVAVKYCDPEKCNEPSVPSGCT